MKFVHVTIRVGGQVMIGVGREWMKVIKAFVGWKHGIDRDRAARVGPSE